MALEIVKYFSDFISTRNRPVVTKLLLSVVLSSALYGCSNDQNVVLEDLATIKQQIKLLSIRVDGISGNLILSHQNEGKDSEKIEKQFSDLTTQVLSLRSMVNDIAEANNRDDNIEKKNCECTSLKKQDVEEIMREELDKYFQYNAAQIYKKMVPACKVYGCKCSGYYELVSYDLARYKCEHCHHSLLCHNW